ncbi:hypothetical protein ACSQ67_025766 [Phaseolus vulgaris]
MSPLDRSVRLFFINFHISYQLGNRQPYTSCPNPGNFMTNLRRRTTNRKIGNFEAIEKDNPAIPIDVVPPSTNPPRRIEREASSLRRPYKIRRRGHRLDVPSMLNLLLASGVGMQISITPEDESVSRVVSTNNLIAKWMELQSWTLLVGRTLGEELERTTTVVVRKLKTEPAESANFLKASLDVMEAFK